MRLGSKASALVLAVRRSGAAALRVCGRHARRDSQARSNGPSRLAAARRFERFVSFSSELVITCDRAAVIRFVNPAARTLLGYEPDELVGRPWSLIVHESDREAELAVIAADFAGRGVALPVQTRYVTKAGEMRLFSWTGGYDAESDEMFYVARDVTADVAARDEADRLSRTDPVTGIANRTHFAASLSIELQRWQRAGQPLGVLMIDVDYFKRVNDTYGHVIGDEVLCSIATRLTRLVRADDLVARWGGEEFALLLPDMPSEEALEQLAESLRQAISARPVLVGDGSSSVAVTVSVGGVFAAPGPWSADCLIDIADRAMYIAKRAGRNQTRLFTPSSVHDVVFEEPEVIRLAQSLALAASLHEGTHQAHCQQVADLCGRIANALGLDASRVLFCRLAGWLHDVGKVGIPDHILTKPGPLDPAEWQTIRRHPALGEDLLNRIPRLADAATAVRSHHERWDGTGYPDGLAGDQIPLEARIVAAADAYSAMTTDRSYQPALPPGQALAELVRCSGSHFDPNVVRALVDLLDIPARAEAA
jgi:diguanylate cyclase (GGDEF)-like protein/PAS domain S-box-containing protein